MKNCIVQCNKSQMGCKYVIGYSGMNVMLHLYTCDLLHGPVL